METNSAPQRPQHPHPVDAGEAEIQEDRVPGFRPGGGEREAAVGRPRHGVAFRDQGAFHGARHVLVVLYEQNAHEASSTGPSREKTKRPPSSWSGGRERIG